MPRITITGTDLIRDALDRTKERIAEAVQKACRDEAKRMFNEHREEMARQSLLYRLSKARDRF